MACEMLRCKIVWTGWAIRRLFAMRHLPNIVKFREFYTSKMHCIFWNFFLHMKLFILFDIICQIQDMSDLSIWTAFSAFYNASRVQATKLWFSTGLVLNVRDRQNILKH